MNKIAQQVMALDDLRIEQFANKRVFVRVDFNVPVQDGIITDFKRLKACVPTIKFLIEHGCRVVLASHFGRPKGKPDAKYSLQPVAQAFTEVLGIKVNFASDCIGKVAKDAVEALKPGEICLLENLRFHAQEEANDPSFSRALADLADVYVNDAFGSAHRAHSSTAGIAEYLRPAVAGFLMKAEVRELGSILKTPERPFTSIIGGSKISSKLAVLDSLVEKSDVMIVGGGMAYTLLKAQGAHVGKSLCEDDMLNEANRIMLKASERGVAVILPSDVLAVKDFGDKAEQPSAFPSAEIPDDFEGCDIGSVTRQNFATMIKQSKTVLWNGPVGVFEDARFAEGTRAVATALSELTSAGGKTVIGGGDSAAAVVGFGFGEDQFSHISTGGGASLEFLSGFVLPGVAALDSI